MKEKRSILLWCSPLFFALVIVIVYPSTHSIYLSFTNAGLIGKERDIIGFNNYIKILTSADFYVALINSVVFTFTSVIIQVIAGITLAILLNQKLKGIRFFRAIVLFPYLVPTVVAVFMFKWLFSPFFGFYSYTLLNIGIWSDPIPLFGTTSTAMSAVILVAFWKYVPFATIISLSRLMTIPKELFEAAEIDGATTLQKIKYIMLPQLKGVVIVIALLRAIWMFRMFDIIWMATGGGPLRATETLPLLAYRYAYQVYDLAAGATIATLLFGIILIFTLIYLKYGEKL